MVTYIVCVQGHIINLLYITLNLYYELIITACSPKSWKTTLLGAAERALLQSIR